MRRFVLLLFVSLSCFVQAQVTIFPEAEGYGRYTSSERGDSIFIVTALDNASSNPAVSTLRHAINQSGTRTIVFAVSKIIRS